MQFVRFFYYKTVNHTCGTVQFCYFMGGFGVVFAVCVVW